MPLTFDYLKAILVQACLDNFERVKFKETKESISFYIPRSKDDVLNITSYLSTLILGLARDQDPQILLLPNKLIKWVRDTFLQIGDEVIKVTIKEDTLREIGVFQPPVQILPSLISSFIEERLALYSRRRNAFMHAVNHGLGDNPVSENEIPMSLIPERYIEAVSSFTIENDNYWIYDPICPSSYVAQGNLYQYHMLANTGGFDSVAVISLERLDHIIEKNTLDFLTCGANLASSFLNLYPG